MITPSLVKDRRVTNPGNRLVGTWMIPNVFRMVAKTRHRGNPLEWWERRIDNHATHLDASRSDMVIEGQGADR